jgi:hypothetical protein
MVALKRLFLDGIDHMKGKKTGGRQKGTKNKRTLAMEAAAARVGQDNPDLEPLDLMLEIMRSEDIPVSARLEAAKAAAPYRHARLNSVEHKGNAGITVTLAGDDLELL